MIHSLIFRSATRLLVPVLLLFSFYLLVEGHHAPGGGFSGGLIGAGSFALLALAFGIRSARSALPAEPPALIGVGLATALASGLVPVAAGGSFLEGRWWTLPLPGDASFDLGTPLLFEVGIYLVVLGAVLSILFELEKRHTRLFAGDEESSFPAA